jgi:hypothetical protein
MGSTKSGGQKTLSKSQLAAKAPKAAKADKAAAAATGPLARQRAEHKNKEDHVKKSDEDKDTVKARFLALSNKKLLRLHDVASELREKFGTAEKAAESLAGLLGRTKDAPFVTKLKSFTPAKLLDLLHVAQKKDVRKKKAEASA